VTNGTMLASLAVLVLFLGVAMPPQQSAAADGAVSIQEAPEETAPPAETTPPETAPPDAGDSETPWWVLLIVLGGLFILIVALLAGSGKKAPTPAAIPAWKAHARNGYAEARWLADNLTESLAIWHGDAEFEERDGTLATDAANAKIWAQLDPVKQRATAELYALEAAAGPGSPALEAAQRTSAAVNETYAATTERSDARLAYRTVAGSSEAADQAADLTGARDREVRASAQLETTHQELTAALVELSPIA
jgi:hypothetical protein